MAVNSKTDDICNIYGCYELKKDASSIEATIGEDIQTLEVCDRHEDFFATTDPENYAIGLSFTGEVEVRYIPAQPAAPVVPEEEPEE